MAEAMTIKEGFLCPICHKDLRSPNSLINHFQELHSEEQVLLKSIKDLYGKAKKKILKLEEKDLENFRNQLTLENEEYNEIQESGLSRSHIEFFKAARRDRLEHRTAETNKLIIRLDRLLRCYGSDRKQHEQELVAWVDGSAVSRCPSCTAFFNIARRQHHCRLCGSIMCQSCSYFLSYEEAQGIVAPVQNVDVGNRDGGTMRENDTLRVCGHCLEMLEIRRRVQVEQMQKPIICQLYTHLQKLKEQIENHIELYLKMHQSLISGEMTFQLQDAHSLKSTIASKAEMMSTISTKITSLPADPIMPMVAVLQVNIKKATSDYIRTYLVSLPSLPTPKELEDIKRERMWKNAMEETAVPTSRIEKVVVTTGWSAATVESGIDGEEDVLIEQINNVRSYIDQARQAQRFEEVASLEENLKMLKNIYYQRRDIKHEH